MLECVIFDLDGLMVDSEPLRFQSYKQAFSAYGFDLTHTTWVRWHNTEATTRAWIESEGLDIDVKPLRNAKNK
jgi:beta-phosphoglucomutase-like phosphatase (HAD superfamily)